MKLRDILALMYKIHVDRGVSLPYICGGTPRDKLLKILSEVSDLDITTGDKTIHNLASEFALDLKEKYTIKSKQMDDGHTSVFIGDFKVDFSSNFVVPHIDEFLHHKGINKPNDMEREMFSRDFTCNSLLMSLDLKKIKDPVKLGLEDIKKKVLRTCLDTDTTLRYNPNRIIRTVYLSAKLDFDVDPEILKWISEHKDLVRLSSDHYLIKNIDKAMAKNPERALYVINKTNLWDTIPVTDSLRPYLNKKNVTKVAQSRTKYSYNDANQYDSPDGASGEQSTNSFFQSDPYPYNQYTPPGMIEGGSDGGGDKLRPSENRQRDGNEFEEFKRFRRKKRLNRLKRLTKLKKMKRKKNVFTPAPFYSSQYGYTGFEGAMTSPLEYYSGSISEEPGAITNNPYNNSYQGGSFSGASSRNVRLKIRGMIFKDYIKT